MFTNLAILGGKNTPLHPPACSKGSGATKSKTEEFKDPPFHMMPLRSTGSKEQQMAVSVGSVQFLLGWSLNEVTTNLGNMLIYWPQNSLCYQVDLSYVLHLEVKHTCGWCKANCVVKRCQKQGMVGVGWNPMLIDINVRCSLDFMVKSQQKISHVVVLLYLKSHVEYPN